jgi:AraC-like DNA-binding protein
MSNGDPLCAGANSGGVRHTAHEATVRVAAFSHLPEVLVSLGADPARVCAAAGFDLKLFEDPDSVVTFRAASHLFRASAEQTGCPHFGVLLGQKHGLDALGFVGLLVKYSPDVGTALRSLVRSMHLHIRGAVTCLEADTRVATLSYAIHAPGAEATNVIADAALGTMLNTVVALCGHHFRPIEVRFVHRAPADLAPYHRFFQAPLHFGMSENALVFSANWLTRPLPAVEPELHRLLQDTMARLEVQYRHDFPEQVRGILRTALLTDHGHADQVASLLCMHSRTLHRRLAASGINFRDLVDECRFEIARQMLAESDRDVGQIAYMLDYADTSAFARAFKRWSGTTPSGWREANQHAGLSTPSLITGPA